MFKDKLVDILICPCMMLVEFKSFAHCTSFI